MEAARTTTDWKCKCTARAGQESLSLVQVARIREYKTPKQLNKETTECTEKARKYATEAKRSRVRVLEQEVGHGRGYQGSAGLAGRRGIYQLEGPKAQVENIL